MNKLILIFIGSVSFVTPIISIAETIAPPGGPYKSIERGMTSPTNIKQVIDNSLGIQTMNNQQRELSVIQEWEKKRQLDMANWLKQQNTQAAMQQHEQYNYPPVAMQNRNQQAMQWSQRQNMPMNASRQQTNSQGVNPQFTQPQTNRMKQYFPSSRGPVYGPNVPPPTYNIPNYQNNLPMNMYPPTRR